MENTGKTVFVPIAWKLKDGTVDRVECGPGTKEACNHAIELESCHPNAEILLTATIAKQWGVCMAHVMRDYIRRLVPHTSTPVHLATMFNTLGEVIAAASYVDTENNRGRTVREVVFVVKDWHLPRLQMIATRVFRARGTNVLIRYEVHHVDAGWLDRGPREWVAYVVNYFRLVGMGM